MNKSTVPSPVETPTSLPDCPYERLRLGVGLRFRDAARLTFLVVATALLAFACGGAVDGSPAPAPAQVCTAHGSDGCPNEAPILYTCTDGLPPDAFLDQATPGRYQPDTYCAPCSAGVHGCPGVTEPQIVAPVPESCDLGSSSDTAQVYRFSDPAAVATGCTRINDGVFLCPLDYCLFGSYAGTCPHCGGGGE